jgi:hypothetical protein
MANFGLIFSPFTVGGLRLKNRILALGSRANNEILQAWEGKVPQILPIGDCVEPRKAKEAIHEGFAAALQV